MSNTTIASMLFALLATFGGTASASSTPTLPPADHWEYIGIVTSEEFYNHREFLHASAPNSLYYQANIPAGATRMWRAKNHNLRVVRCHPARVRFD